MKNNSVDELKKKLARYCAWRERCTAEAKEKLMSLGATPKEKDLVIQWLRAENYINDERFSFAYASGKFNYNRWGRIRIAGELSRRGIESKVIDQALSSIEEENYQNAANALAMKKYHEVKDDSFHSRKQKTAAYLISKGYENEIAWNAVKTVSHQQNDS